MTFCQQTYSCHALLPSYLSFPHLWCPCLGFNLSLISNTIISYPKKKNNQNNITNHRLLTITKRVVPIQSWTIAKDRRVDFCLHFGQWKCQNYRRFGLAGKSHQNNMADVEEEILLQANLFLLLVLKRRHCQLQNVENILDFEILLEGSVFNRFRSLSSSSSSFYLRPYAVHMLHHGIWPPPPLLIN